MTLRAFPRSLAGLIAAVGVLCALGALAWSVGGTMSAEKIRRVAGKSYAFDLPRQALGVGVLAADSNEDPTRSRLRLFEDGNPLPGAHSPHQEIADLGGGRYSHWGRAIIFSASDGSDPNTNGRSYSYTAQSRVNPLLLYVGWGLLILVAVKALYRCLSSRWGDVRRILIPLGLAVGSIVLALSGLEVACRLATPPYCPSSWPSMHNPKVGFTFQPGAKVNWGGVKGVPQEFCVSEYANSLGLLEREPPTSKAQGTLRIVLLGDSFLEAAQVKMSDKFHVLMERTLTKALGRPIQTVALGYSGMGTANLLAFWEEWGRTYAPDLVVLLVVNNDLMNNLVDKECVGNGWDPAHPPRLFFRIDAGGGLSVVPIDPEWRVHAENRTPSAGGVRRLDDFLAPRSALWRFVIPRLRMQPWARTIMVHLGFLDPRAAPMSLDEIKAQDYFNHLTPPDWARDALRLQGALLARFRDEVRQAGASLLVVYVPSVPEVTRLGEAYEVGGVAGRFGLRGQRVGREADALGLPFLDLGETFHARPEPWRASFRYDPHWSPLGHAWAAEDISGFILRHDLLGPGKEKQ